MKTLKLIIFYLLIPIMLLAEDGYIYFVVDGSGSMKGVPLQEAKDAMQKMAKQFFADGKKIALVVGKDRCSGGTRIDTEFFSSLAELNKALARIDPTSGHNITLGFEYAQEQMKTNSYTGHIYMFGDCDGLEHCRSIRNIADKYKKENYLTPFTYLQVDGCTDQEKTSWNNTLKDIGASTGSADTFDYKSIISKKIDIHKKYFTNVKFINKDATENRGNNFRTNPWRCIDSDGLLWLAITKQEQSLNFFITAPKNRSQYKKDTNNKTVEEFIKELNDNNSCGKSDWRLPDNFELSRLTQLGAELRAEMFPYIKIWAHISSTGGKYNRFKKGVNLNDGNSYDYREDRPYASIFVSGDIDKTLFVASEELLNRYNILFNPSPLPVHTSKPIPTPKKVKPTPIPTSQPPKECTVAMVAFDECTHAECVKYGDCVGVAKK